MKSKKRKRKWNIRKYIAIILISVSLACGAYFLYDYFLGSKTIPSVEKLIQEKRDIKFSDKDENQPNIINYVNELPNFRSQYGNANIMGRLEIPNMNINTLVTRTTNNEYYLNYNLYNQYDALGVPFFDYRNTSLSTDRQINIYGHNTTNSKYLDQLPFINLEAYVDENIFNNYKDVYLSIDEKQIHYEIVAVKIITNADYEHMKVIFYSDEDFLKHVAKLLDNTLYKDSNIMISAEDHLLVLQVCHYNPPHTYLLVICQEKK